MVETRMTSGGGGARIAEEIRGRELATESVFTNAAVGELVEIILRACEESDPGQVRFQLSRYHPIEEARDADDLRVVRRALLGDGHRVKHSSHGSHAKLSKLSKLGSGLV
jgi:hypothetical protein